MSCVARVNPAMARLGKPTAVVDVDGTAPDGWYADVAGWGLGVYRRHGSESWTRELIATLSYDGWQDDVADTKGVWNPGRKCRECATSSRSTTAGLRGQGGRCRWTRSKTRSSKAVTVRAAAGDLRRPGVNGNRPSHLH
eukprot:scaffold85715_cov62-Phaeocystis_antarctica.AAC.6